MSIQVMQSHKEYPYANRDNWGFKKKIRNLNI